MQQHENQLNQPEISYETDQITNGVDTNEISIEKTNLLTSFH